MKVLSDLEFEEKVIALRVALVQLLQQRLVLDHRARVGHVLLVGQRVIVIVAGLLRVVRRHVRVCAQRKQHNMSYVT